MITAAEMVEKLKDVGRGSLVFVSYLAGGPVSDVAIHEAERAIEAGMAPRHFVGTLESVWRTRKGQWVMTIMAYNRDRLTGDGLKEGNYRTMNPELGQLLSLEVIDLRPKDKVQVIRDMMYELSRDDLQLVNNLMTKLLKKEVP